jgi:predicted MPP superfamily phosphohydrolase
MKKLLQITALLLCGLFLIAGYNLLDNNRVVTVKQQVKIKNLPKAFEGFTILQVSDLHGKRFDSDQAQLLSAINHTQYDLLVFTGDMADANDMDNQPFYDLLDGIQNKNLAFTTYGNTGPWGIDTRTGQLTADGKIIESKGVRNITGLHAIQRGDQKIWISEFNLIEWVKIITLDEAQSQLKKIGLSPEDTQLYQAQEKYALQLIQDLGKIRPEDTLIGITHNPFSIDSVSDMPAMIPSYDLIIAGHYHGGQMRLPFWGALYIPDGASETHGYFPPQDRVSGLRDWGSFQQYISRGLGASSSIPALNFRLFNSPEINCITLSAGD